MILQLDGDMTIRDLVGRHPQTRSVFERHEIDYCCGGGKSLAEAARERGVELDALCSELEEALNAPQQGEAVERDWYNASLTELVHHIVDVHHVYMKAALPRLRTLVPTVLKAHGARHGDMLRQVQGLFNALDAEISSHLLKEEQVLFPFIEAAESNNDPGSLPLSAPCGSVQYPIRQMEHEHESAGQALAMLREVTGNYALPPDACPTFRAMYEELQRMEADLHQHIHLENNILFPRAMQLDR